MQQATSIVLLKNSFAPRASRPASPLRRRARSAPAGLAGLIKLLTLLSLDAVEKVAPVEVAVLARVGERVLEAGFGRDVPGS